MVSEIVADDEALWHSRDEVTGARTTISLRDAEAQGLISIEAASTGELLSLTSRFDDVFARGLHDGELEALALLAERQDFGETIFCAGDGAAIQAAAMLGMDERSDSLEALLEVVGLSKKLDWPLTKAFHHKHRRDGLENRLSGLGLRK